jgi:hypothetical protein
MVMHRPFPDFPDLSASFPWRLFEAVDGGRTAILSEVDLSILIRAHRYIDDYSFLNINVSIEC